MQIHQAGRLLVGSMVVYAVVAACSGSEGARSVASGGSAAHAPDSSDSGGRDSDDGSATGAAGGATGTDSATQDSVADALLDPVPEARADATSSCALCSGTAQRSVTADMDPAQEARGTVVLGAAPLHTLSTNVVAEGPLFIVHADTPPKVSYYTVLKTERCAHDISATADATSAVPYDTFGPVPPVHHLSAGGSLVRSNKDEVKLRVRSDEKLCVSQVADSRNQVSPTPVAPPERTLRWLGFRPY
jgi:hypothetical protein